MGLGGIPETGMGGGGGVLAATSAAYVGGVQKRGAAVMKAAGQWREERADQAKRSGEKETQAVHGDLSAWFFRRAKVKPAIVSRYNAAVDAFRRWAHLVPAALRRLTPDDLGSRVEACFEYDHTLEVWRSTKQLVGDVVGRAA